MELQKREKKVKNLLVVQVLVVITDVSVLFFMKDSKFGLPNRTEPKNNTIAFNKNMYKSMGFLKTAKFRYAREVSDRY